MDEELGLRSRRPRVPPWDGSGGRFSGARTHSGTAEDLAESGGRGWLATRDSGKHAGDAPSLRRRSPLSELVASPKGMTSERNAGSPGSHLVPTPLWCTTAAACGIAFGIQRRVVERECQPK